MKILLVHNDFDSDIGGGRKVIETLFEAFLNNNKYELFVVSIDVRSINKKQILLDSCIRKNVGFEVIESNNSANIIPSFIRMLLKFRPDLILDQSALNMRVFTLLSSTCLGLRKKHVFIDHAPASSILPRLANKWVKLLIPLSYRLSAHFVTVSQALLEDTCNRFSLNSNKVSCLYNPINTEAIKSRSFCDFDEMLFEDKPVIVTVCRLDPLQKDLSTLITCFKKVKNSIPAARLLVIGDGAGMQEWKDLSRELGVDESIKFLGYKRNPYPYMRKADVFVHSSFYESFGLSIVEAMICKTPVIATDCHFGPSEILNNGEFGELVSVKNSNVMAEKIIKILSNPAAYKTKAKKAYKRAMDFSLANSIDAYKRLFERFSDADSN